MDTTRVPYFSPAAATHLQSIVALFPLFIGKELISGVAPFGTWATGQGAMPSFPLRTRRHKEDGRFCSSRRKSEPGEMSLLPYGP